MNDDCAVLGIDGCPGGWVGALVTGSKVSWHAGSLSSLLTLKAAVVAIDIPLVLPVGGQRRTCEVAAKARLGAQRSSVFFAPPGVVLQAGSHAEASLLSREAGSVGVSIQTWNIVPKIREALPYAEQLVEVHPEVSFRALTAVVLGSKKTVAGRQARLSALQSWLPNVTVPVPRPGRAAVDDCLDALVCAWSAQRWLRGEAEVLGGDVDATGQVMRIVI